MQSEKQMKPKFKVGDRVRVIGPFRDAAPEHDEELEREVSDFDAGAFYNLDELVYEGPRYEVHGWWYGEDAIELVEEEPKDNVNHPSHYNNSGIECIDAIEATLGPKGFQAYCKGNCMKYLWRYEYKNGLEDLEKARVYLEWMIESIRKES